MQGADAGTRDSHKPGFDLLIVGIPPLEMTPYSQSLAAQDSEKLELLELLVLQYNLELAQAAKALKVEVKKMKVLPNVFYYDMAKLVCIFIALWTFSSRCIILTFTLCFFNSGDLSTLIRNHTAFLPIW